MRSVCSLFCLVLCAAAAWSGCGRQEAQDRAEIAALERALGAVSMASKGERGAALASLQALTLKAEPIAAVRDICAEAFSAVGGTEAILAQARTSTEAAEAAVASVSLSGDDGKAVAAAQLEAQAASNLAGLDQAISQAQSLVDECDRRRALLRARLRSR